MAFAIARNENTDSLFSPDLYLLSFSLYGCLSFFIATLNGEILPRATPKSPVVVYRRLRFTQAHVKYSIAEMEVATPFCKIHYRPDCVNNTYYLRCTLCAFSHVSVHAFSVIHEFHPFISQ